MEKSAAPQKEEYLVKVTDATNSEKPNNHIVDTNEMVSSQTEISDEEIEKSAENAWSDYEYEEGNLYSTTFRDGWLMGIDWYKKKLNNK